MIELKTGETRCWDCHLPTPKATSIEVNKVDGGSYVFCSWDCASNFCAFMAPSFLPTLPSSNTGVVLQEGVSK
jgi:hypothetical protein